MCFLLSLVSKSFSFLLRLFLYRKSMLSTNKNRSSCSQMFFKIVVLKNFTIFTGKPLRWSLFAGHQACNFIKNTPAQIFFVNIAKIFKTTFFREHFWWLLLKKLKLTTLFSNKGKYIGPLTAWLYFRNKFLGSCTF